MRLKSFSGMSSSKGPSVAERTLAVLELIAGSEEPLSLSALMAQIQLPKATTHRIAILLQDLGFVERTLDGRKYGIGRRLALLASDAMRHSTQWGARRAILNGLVLDVGETCNVTVLDGTELVYLDRVESAWPLQIRLPVGSRVPLHCTASGKLFLSHMDPARRRALLAAHAIHPHTTRTITRLEKLEREIERISETGVGTDNEEFIDGMAAAAVPVLDAKRRICATVAVHGPVARLPLDRAIALAPKLARAAEMLSQAYFHDSKASNARGKELKPARQSQPQKRPRTAASG